MASVAQDILFAINGVDLACVLQSIKISGTAETKQTTSLCTTGAHTYQKALTERNISASGFFKSSATTADDANGLLQTALTSVTADYLALFARDGGTIGQLAEMFNLKETKYDIENVVGELISAAFDAKSTSTDTAKNYQAGVVLFNETVTGATNGTSYDTTSGGTGYLIQVHVLDGDDTASVTIQHSTDDAIWADLVAAANYTTNTATQLASTVTSVNRYVRAQANVNGTTNTVAIGALVGYSG